MSEQPQPTSANANPSTPPTGDGKPMLAVPSIANLTVVAPASSMPKKTWLSDTEGRRTEAIRSSLTSFHASRQFLTEGRLDDEERLIRYFEGITMSLEREPTSEQMDEMRRAFESVFLYHSDEADKDKDPIGGVESQLLGLQAKHNLAVIEHREYVRAAGELAVQDKYKKPNEVDLSCRKNLTLCEDEELRLKAKEHSRRAVDQYRDAWENAAKLKQKLKKDLPKAKRGEIESLEDRCQALFDVATLGQLEIEASRLELDYIFEPPAAGSEDRSESGSKDLAMRTPSVEPSADGSETPSESHSEEQIMDSGQTPIGDSSKQSESSSKMEAQAAEQWPLSKLVVWILGFIRNRWAETILWAEKNRKQQQNPTSTSGTGELETISGTRDPEQKARELKATVREALDAERKHLDAGSRRTRPAAN